jgi:hypothetical protein
MDPARGFVVTRYCVPLSLSVPGESYKHGWSRWHIGSIGLPLILEAIIATSRPH